VFTVGQRINQTIVWTLLLSQMVREVAKQTSDVVVMDTTDATVLAQAIS